MNAVLDFPPLDGFLPDQAPVIVVEQTTVQVVTIRDTVLDQFRATEGDLLALAAKYKDVAYDVNTPRGMAEATAARMDLRENGRYLVQRAEKRIKADVNDLKRVMADEVERLVGIVRPVEDAIDAQIKAREAVLAAEKAERDRIEAERVGRHEAFIATIKAYLQHCQQPGMTAARIEAGMKALSAIAIGPEREEFAVPAASAQCETLEAMRVLHAQAAGREAEAERLELQRHEQARVAEEQRIERERIAAEAAEIRRQAVELAAQRAEPERLEKLAEERRAAAEKAAISAPVQERPFGVDLPRSTATPPMALAADTYLPASTAAAPLKPAAEVPTVSLSIIAKRLGFALPGAFIEQTLKLPPAGRQGAAVLWRESDWPAIKEALCMYVEALP